MDDDMEVSPIETSLLRAMEIVRNCSADLRNIEHLGSTMLPSSFDDAMKDLFTALVRVDKETAACLWYINHAG